MYLGDGITFGDRVVAAANQDHDEASQYPQSIDRFG